MGLHDDWKVTNIIKSYLETILGSQFSVVINIQLDHYHRLIEVFFYTYSLSAHLSLLKALMTYNICIILPTAFENLIGVKLLILTFQLVILCKFSSVCCWCYSLSSHSLLTAAETGQRSQEEQQEQGEADAQD